MINPQKFNIVNPKRGSSDALYERVDPVPMWQRCLRYRPRSKDLRAFNPLRDKIRQIPGCVQGICSPSPGAVRGKHAVSSRYGGTKPNTDRELSKASPKSIRVARAPGTGNHPLASNPVPRVQPISPKPLDPVLSSAFVEESSLNAAYGEPGRARVYDINYNPPPSCTPLQPNHKIGMALTTTQTILNYSNGHGDTHDKVRSILQIDGGAMRIEPKNSDLIELVDIPILMPEYHNRPKRKPIVQKRATHEIQHHPLPHLASTHNVIQMLEVEASKQEQEKAVEATTYLGLYTQNSSTPRNSRRCGQVWDREETEDSFRAMKLLKDSL